MRKVARVAGKAAPTVAVVGALTAVPQVRDFVTGAPSATAGHPAAAQVTGSGQVASAADDGNPASFNVRPYLPRHAAVAAGRSAPATRRPRRPAHAVAQPSSAPATPAIATSASGSSSTSGSSSGSGGASHGLPVCTGTQGLLPDNYGAIVDFLVAHGYSGFAAAGIAGNIYQESKGNPESVGSGGGGLIGWTPLPAGFVTGNPSADLQTQLQALLTYNQQWSQFIPALNAATSAPEAADIFMDDFERPGLPVAANREAAAQAVATACGI